MIYKHYSDYSGPWPYENFTKHEVSCKHCGEFYYDAPAMDKLQRLRDLWGRPLVINSGHRCKSHNANVGGAPGSQHLKLAFDVRMPKATASRVSGSHSQQEFVRLARQVGFTGIGVYNSFVHLDTGPARTWKG